ncbi:hypothetical protein F5141DRAFT_1277001 [Pisolithus sp. B1]|nr:hypothetical protein F5141DRAFT_1277001 [Pisolithus sp. B1]
MVVVLDIRPFSDTLFMYGEASSLSAFSLAGHVNISIASPKSFLNRSKPTTRLLLRSLVITFEGQSEVITPVTGYAPVRLCSISQELVRGDPIELSNEGLEYSTSTCSWNAVFDIRVPGWLPVTSTYGDADFEETGTRYALCATATYVHLEDDPSSFSWLNFCAPLCSRSRTVDAPRCPVTLRRVIEPPTGPSGSFPLAMYVVDTQKELDDTREGPSTTPFDVLGKIEVVACTPTAVSMGETSLPFTLRLRAKDLTHSERECLRLTEFSVDIKQVEVYRNTTSEDYAGGFPIPSQRHQPPNEPLRSHHPVHTLCSVDAFQTAQSPRSSVGRSFSLLPENSSGRYVIGGDGRIFTNINDPWFSTRVPYAVDWAGPCVRRMTESSPLFSVRHTLSVSIQCAYDLPEKEPVCLLSPRPPSAGYHISDTSSGETQLETSFAQSLPAYSQLFHQNGERKIDFSIPLPLYRPPSIPVSQSPDPSTGSQKDDSSN